jgi:hypothetical protein
MEAKQAVLIIGNAPSCKISKIKKENIQQFSRIIALGAGIFYLPIDLINYWITRESTYLQKPQDYTKACFILELNKTYPFVNSKIKTPSLGYFAISQFLHNGYDPYITGFTLDITKLDNGTFWNPEIKRFNLYHDLIKETLDIKSMLHERKIFEF